MNRRPSCGAFLALLVAVVAGCVPTLVVVQDTAGVPHTGDTALSRAARARCAPPAPVEPNPRATVAPPVEATCSP